MTTQLRDLNRLPEPCRPYDIGYRDENPVEVWQILERLTRPQLERMALALAVQYPDVFEHRLLELFHQEVTG